MSDKKELTAEEIQKAKEDLLDLFPNFKGFVTPTLVAEMCLKYHKAKLAESSGEELVTVKECVELFSVPATHHKKLRSCLELANQRHEERMKRERAMLELTSQSVEDGERVYTEARVKERAIEFALTVWIDITEFDPAPLHRIKEIYNEKYGSDDLA